MYALLERLEVETARSGDDDLAVEHAALRKLLFEHRDQLGEVTVERFGVAALDQHLVAVAKHQRAKAVPLGLEAPGIAGGNFGDAFGEHRKHGRLDRKVHA